MELAQIHKMFPRNNATRGIHSIAHMLFFLFKVRLNNVASGGRWLTNSLVCSETVTEKWRVWVGCGKCVCGPEQYVKTCVLKRLLQSFQQPPSRSAVLCWTPDFSAYRLSPGVCQSATLHYTAACSGQPGKECHNEGKGCVIRYEKVCACVLWKKKGIQCLYIKVYLALCSPAARQFPLKMAEHCDQRAQLTLPKVPSPSRMSTCQPFHSSSLQ